MVSPDKYVLAAIEVKTFLVILTSTTNNSADAELVSMQIRTE